MSKSGMKVFIADIIHPRGIDLLESNGFDVIKAYNLSNKQLIKFISIFNSSQSSKKTSVLIIRTTRKLGKSDILSVSKLTDVNLICAASSGYDNIDLKEAKKNR